MTQEGKQIEKICEMTNWDYYEAVERFQRILEATGINKALKRRGAKEGRCRHNVYAGQSKGRNLLRAGLLGGECIQESGYSPQCVCGACLG